MKRLRKAANTVPAAPVIAAMFALAAAAVIALMPHWLFQYYVQRIGLPALIPAAAPPLGDTARIAAAFAAFAVTGAVVWAAISQIEKRLSRPRTAARPIVAAGPPAPLRAEAELGAPMMSDEAMTQAREELLLEPEMVEDVRAETVRAPLPQPVDEPVLAATEPEPEPEPEPAIIEAIAPLPAAPVASLPVAPETLGGLMKRLDKALLDKPVGWKPDPALIAAR